MIIDDFIPELEIENENPDTPPNEEEGRTQEKENVVATTEFSHDDIFTSAPEEGDEKPKENGEEEEEENSTKPTENAKEKADSDDEGEEDAMLEPIYNTFLQKGYIMEQEGEEAPKTWEELDERINQIPKRVSEALVTSIPEDGQPLLKYLLTAGADLNKDKLKEFYNVYLEEAEQIEPVDESQARQYLERVFTKQGMNKTAMKASLDALEDSEELMSEAKRVYELNVSEKKTDKIIEETEDEKKSRIANSKRYWNSIADTIQSTGWKTQKQREIYRELESKETTNKITSAYKDPKALVVLADFMSHYNPETGEFNLDAYKAQVASKETKSIKDNIIRDQFSSVSVKNNMKGGKNPSKNEMDKLEPII